MQNPTMPALWLWCASALTLQAALPPMRPYSIDLPHHILRFSVPEEIADGMRPTEVEQRFDPLDASFEKNGFREIAGTLYDIKGPFWVGAYGSLKFGFSIQQRSSAYQEGIATIEGLDRYIRWWISTGKHAADFSISRTTLNGTSAVCRLWNEFGNPSKSEPRLLQIFSIPLDDTIFLDVDFNLTQWEGGRGKEGKWKPKAEALREAIKATVVLEPKPTAAR